MKHKVEIFSADCPLCHHAVDVVRRIVQNTHAIEVLNLHEKRAVKRGEELGIRSVPAVAIDGKLARCCEGRGIDEEAMRSAGLGEAP